VLDINWIGAPFCCVSGPQGSGWAGSNMQIMPRIEMSCTRYLSWRRRSRKKRKPKAGVVACGLTGFLTWRRNVQVPRTLVGVTGGALCCGLRLKAFTLVLERHSQPRSQTRAVAGVEDLRLASREASPLPRKGEGLFRCGPFPATSVSTHELLS
jgi:hypothetical protein